MNKKVSLFILMVAASLNWKRWQSMKGENLNESFLKGGGDEACH